MTFALLCALGALVFLIGQDKGDLTNRNGRSVAFLQVVLACTHDWLRKHEIIGLALLAYPRLPLSATLAIKQAKIERLVWIRLLCVSIIAVIAEYLLSRLHGGFRLTARIGFVFYMLLLQFTLLLSLLRPLFGAAIDPNTGSLDASQARKRTPHIPTPRRSLLLALVNFFEILLAWAIIYRCLMPGIVTTMDQANYFSVVTMTTLGYGDINAGGRTLVQLAVTTNMVVILVFSICHITTIMGAMSSGEDFSADNPTDPPEK